MYYSHVDITSEAYVKLNIRNLLVGLIIIIVLVVVLLQSDQLIELGETMKKGALLPLILAVCTQLCKYVAQSFAYSTAFAAVGERMKPREMLPLVFGTFFMNTIAPSLNMAGATLVVDDARRRGIAAGKATSAFFLMQITIESGFATIMLVGFGILLATGNLSPLWLLLGLVVLLMIFVLVGILILGYKKPELLTRMLGPVERFVNKVLVRFKRSPLKSWKETAVTSFAEAAWLISQNPKTTIKAFIFSILASTCELACFCLVGISFGVYNPQALVCGYVVATLFAMVSITPQGVGVVELVVVALLTSYEGVSGAAGAATALVYRGLVFWMPFLIGAILIQRTKFFKEDKEKKARRKKVSTDAKRLERQKKSVSVAAQKKPSSPRPGSAHNPIQVRPHSEKDASSESPPTQPFPQRNNSDHK